MADIMASRSIARPSAFRYTLAISVTFKCSKPTVITNDLRRQRGLLL